MNPYRTFAVLTLLCSALSAQPIVRENIQRTPGTNTIVGTQANAPFKVDTITALKAVAAAARVNGQQCEVAGYSSASDGGGGIFVFNSASSASDDGGTVLAPNVGTGRWLRVAANEYVRPEWWGGFADASTNCSAAFTSALAVGPQVKLSQGTYILATTVALPENRTVVGAGQATTTLRFTGTGPALTFTPAGDGNLSLQDFNMTATNVGATYAIKGTNGYHVSLFRIKVQAGGRFSGGALNIHTVNPGNAATWSILACQLLQTGGDGITIDGNGGTGGIFVSHCRIQGNAGKGINITATPGNELLALSNDIEGNGGGAIYADWLSGSIIGNHMEQGGGSGIPIVLATNGVVNGVTIMDNGISGSGSQEVLIDIKGAGASLGVNIENNTFAGASLGAIRYSQIWGFSVRNNNAFGLPTLLVGGNIWYTTRNLFVQDYSATRFMGQPQGGPPGISAVSFDAGLIIGGANGSPGTRGAAITAHMSGTTTWDAPNLTTGTQTTTTVTVTGAELGDIAMASLGVSQNGCVLTAYVSASNTVTVVLRNDTGSDKDLASTTLRASAWSYTQRNQDAFPW